MLITEWGEALDRSAPLPEYPRPQLVRGSYLNLNGPWEYAFTADMKKPEEYAGEIVVPFSPESPLSGVGRTLRAGEYLWYRRRYTLPAGCHIGRVLLHCGAVVRARLGERPRRRGPHGRLPALFGGHHRAA